MYFDVNDILFLNSKDFKKYKKFNKWLSKNDFGPDPIGFNISVFLSVILAIYLLFRWNFFSWNSNEEGIIKTIAYFFSIFFFIGYPLTLVSMGIFGLIIYPIFRNIIQWILKGFVIDKKYISRGNFFEANEGRIKGLICSYIKDEHNHLLKELSGKKIEIGRFNALKNEYIENYSFIKSAHNSIGYLREISIFLSKSKEIIETLVYHDPKEDYVSSDTSIYGKSDLNLNSVLTDVNEKFKSPDLNKNEGPLIDINKKPLSDLESQNKDHLIPLSEKYKKALSNSTSKESQPLEKKINEILNREEKIHTQPKKVTTFKKVFKRKEQKNKISAQVQQKDRMERLLEKAVKKVNKAKGSTPKTISLNSAKINWPEINARRKNIGDAGELIVYNFEIEKLLRSDLIELIPKIEHSSQVYGDGCGYDIKSFNENGMVMYIEVKSTEGELNNPIYFSRNELDKMKELGENYWLYRVHSLDLSDKTGKISIFSGYSNITDNFEFTPETVKARLK